MDIKSDTLFLAEISLPPAKLDPPRIGLDVIIKITRKPCAWAPNPQFWSYAHPLFLCRGHPPTIRRSNPQFWSSNGAQPEIWQDKRNHAHDFNFPQNLEIWSHGGPRPIAHLYAPPRDSIAIHASLMGGISVRLQPFTSTYFS